jgi:hypothetical protein
MQGFVRKKENPANRRNQCVVLGNDPGVTGVRLDRIPSAG